VPIAGSQRQRGAATGPPAAEAFAARAAEAR